jgi:hypothetical protein
VQLGEFQVNLGFGWSRVRVRVGVLLGYNTRSEGFY